MIAPRTLLRLVPQPITAWLRTQNRLTLIGLMLAAIALLTAVSWLVGSRIKSPAQIAAEMSPPPAAPIFHPVEQRVLTSDIVTRGTARFALPQAVTLAHSAVRPQEELVTSLPLPAAQLAEGEMVLTVAGRPVFVMKGTFPAFRDMLPGTHGEDVRQLEAGLKRLGFYPGVIDGTYDTRTAAAVAAWYTSARWTTFEPTPELLTEMHTLAEKVAIAEKDHLAATLAADPKLVTAVRAKAAAANETAAADVAAKTATHTKVMGDLSSTNEERAKAAAELRAAQATWQATRQEGTIAVQTAVNTQKVSGREATVAKTVAANHAADLARLQRKAGTIIPASEIMFVAALPARVKQIDVTVGAPAKGALLTVASNQIVIDSAVQLAEAALVKPNMAVTIDEPELGIAATGTVTRVAEAPGTNGVDAFHVYIEVAVNATPTTLEGTSLRITIPIESTKGSALVVPVSAVSLAADGTSRVQVNQNGKLAYVTVTTGLSAQGFVEVVPVDGTLQPGEQVVIGFE